MNLLPRDEATPLDRLIESLRAFDGTTPILENDIEHDRFCVMLRLRGEEGYQ